MSKSFQKRRYRAPALDKGLDILEYLASERLPRSLLEVAEGLGRSSGEIYRMLMCLEERGYVVREVESGRFRLTLRLYELGHKHNPTMLLRRAARLPMELLAEEVNQACHLSVQYGRSILVLMERMPTRHICLAVGEGAVSSLIGTNSGKVILSGMGEDAVAELLKDDRQFQAMTRSRRTAFLAMLARIRQVGELITESSQGKGITDIVVPVGIEGTDTFGALALSHLDATHTSQLLSALRQCASQINQNLGVGK